MAPLIWSPQAADDLDAICRFIERDFVTYAGEFAARILHAVELMREFPEAGRIVPEFGDPMLRELLYGSYRVIYELRAGSIHILTIHHAARLLRERPG